MAAALLTPAVAPAASDPEIAELRSMINQMKQQYEARIRDLERRLAKAEAKGPAEPKRRFKNKRYVLDRGTGLWPVWRAGRPPPRCLSCF